VKIASVVAIKAKLSAYLKASEEGSVVITRHGKPIAVMLAVTDEAELERLLLSYSPQLQTLLNSAEQRIQTSGGLEHEAFWAAVEAAAEDADSA
jgi:prevent-host-death family protein